MSTVLVIYDWYLLPSSPLYGYHDSEQLFLKVYFYNPAMVRRTTELLLSGAVMGTEWGGYQEHRSVRGGVELDNQWNT